MWGVRGVAQRGKMSAAMFVGPFGFGSGSGMDWMSSSACYDKSKNVKVCIFPGPSASSSPDPKQYASLDFFLF